MPTSYGLPDRISLTRSTEGLLAPSTQQIESAESTLYSHSLTPLHNKRQQHGVLLPHINLQRILCRNWLRPDNRMGPRRRPLHIGHPNLPWRPITNHLLHVSLLISCQSFHRIPQSRQCLEESLIGAKDFTNIWTYQAGTWKYATLEAAQYRGDDHYPATGSTCTHPH